MIVPFAGSGPALQAVCERVSKLALRPGDSLLVVDNTPERVSGGTELVAGVPVLLAADRPTPAFARNRGAARGTAEWLVFFDADAVPDADLLDRYFDPPPGPRAALLGGGVRDEQVPPDAPPAARYSYLRGAMSQERSFDRGQWSYPKSANVACRRTAFEQLGGFREEIRAGEDADLTYRLEAEGWGVERREAAVVVHASRTTISAMVRQQLLWGAGGAWLHRRYPGSVSLARGPGLVWWVMRELARGLWGLRRHDRDQTIVALLGPVEAVAWQLGRFISNERPARHPPLC